MVEYLKNIKIFHFIVSEFQYSIYYITQVYYNNQYVRLKKYGHLHKITTLDFKPFFI